MNDSEIMSSAPATVFPDLSHYEYPCDFNQMADSGVVAVIWKATQGAGNQDQTYNDARAKALAAGLAWGSYHFADGSAVGRQVNNYLSHALPTSDDLICLDAEDYGANTITLGDAKKWIQAVEDNLGRANQCVLYSGNWIKEKLGDNTSDPFWGAHRLWLAQYGTTPSWPKAWDNYWIWQFTDGGSGPKPHKCAGVGACDMNSFNGSADQLLAEWASGQAAPPPGPPRHSATVIVIAPPGVKVVVQKAP